MIENEFGEFFPPTLDESGNSYNSQFTIRDYFAAKAMQGELASQANGSEWIDIDKLAKYSYDIADAMLQARKS